MNEEQKAILFDILETLTETDEVRANPDIRLFDEGLLDSVGTVQLIVEIEACLGCAVPLSSFDRNEWATPNMILAKIGELQS
jgi:D-alanine--poly(phosphoribitol) ligase subunit 2